MLEIIFFNSVELPIFQLSALKKILQKIQIEQKEKNISDQELLDKKLFDDMFNFGTQLRFSIDKSLGLAEVFTGKNSPKTTNKYETIDEYIDEMALALDFLKNLQKSDFENSLNREFSHPVFEQGKKLKGIDIIPFFLPNMYFHITTAYDILRHNGFNIGKADFLGENVFKKFQ